MRKQQDRISEIMILDFAHVLNSRATIEARKSSKCADLNYEKNEMEQKMRDE